MKMPDHVYAVILAGGSGTRFWPKSRHLTPKQLCAIGSSDLTMLETTLARLDGFIPPERRLIVTHKDQIAETKRIAGERCAHFLAEPEARNTANALALAAVELNARHAGGEEPIMISLHADHVIQKVDDFRTALRHAVAVAETGYLTLLGIVPQYAETGYGYIEKGRELVGPKREGFKVASFREKPHLSLAEEYVASGNFYWNAGIFVWRVSTLLSELKERLPTTVAKLSALAKPGVGIRDVDSESLARVYGELPKIAIDNAVLEVSTNVAMVEADIGWQDVGSWDALAQCFTTDANGNLTYGDVLTIDSRDTTVDSDGPFVACVGLKDMVVVCAKGAVLVCPRDKAQDVKKVVETLKAEGRTELL